MLGLILPFLTNLIGGPLVNGIVDAYKAKLAAAGSADALTVTLAQRELLVEQREREIDAAILVAEQGNWFTRWIRPMWAFPFVIYTWKIVLWDVVLGWGTTDPIKGATATLGVTIAAAYFGGRTIEKVASILNRKK